MNGPAGKTREEAWFDAPAPLLPEILALNGRWQGSKPAVICDDDILSWAEFHRDLCRVANGLRALGIQPGDRVAVLMDNSPEMILALYGIVVAGAVTVPLNVMTADRALAGMIEDAGARAVFTNGAHQERLVSLHDRDGERHWIHAGATGPGRLEFAAWLGEQSDEDPRLALADEDECNIIYSSGTTGLPKGIVHTHRRRLDWFYDLAIALRYDRASVNLCSIGLFSNISWAGMGSTLLAGGTVVILRAFDAARWLETVAARGVTHSAMVPVQFERILDAPNFEATELDSIKSLMCCGAPLDRDLKLRIMERLAPNLVELYGLTEGLITTLEPEDARTRPDSVGKPIMGTDLRILDDRDRPCPANQAGEIVGRGRFVMAGYAGRDDANREATWEDEEGRRWLRTGDIGRLDEEGFLFLVDRKKDLIISGGQNIYPADIEAVLSEHPAVAEAAVVGVPSPRWGESPLAVVVAAGEVVAAELEAWTNDRVGKHQRVVGVAFLDELPRNANGKILKRELRERFKNWLEPRAGSGEPNAACKPGGSAS